MNVPLTPLGWARRILSAVVCVSGLAMVMAKTGENVPSADSIGQVSAFIFVLSLIALVEVARREHAEAEHASAEREHQQLAMLKLQVELAKAKASSTKTAEPRAEDHPS